MAIPTTIEIAGISYNNVPIALQGTGFSEVQVMKADFYERPPVISEGAYDSNMHRIVS